MSPQLPRPLPPPLKIVHPPGVIGVANAMARITTDINTVTTPATIRIIAHFVVDEERIETSDANATRQVAQLHVQLWTWIVHPGVQPTNYVAKYTEKYAKNGGRCLHFWKFCVQKVRCKKIGEKWKFRIYSSIIGD